MNKRTTFSFWYLALLLLAIFALQFIGLRHGPTEILYSDFKGFVAEEKVALASIGREEIKGELLLPADEEVGLTDRERQPAKTLGKRDMKDSQQRYRVPFVTSRPADDKGLFELLDKSKVSYGQEQNSEWPTVLFTWLLPLFLIVLLGVLIMRQMGRAGSMVMSFGKSKAKIVVEKDTKTTFDDVAGCEEAKEELREIIEFLKNPKKFQSLGGKIPKGVLLMGPPGTGKTLIARAVAGEAGVPFFSISGSDFVEMFVGVGAARVRDLFTQAKTKAPCIVFIDEIDAVGRQRGAGIGGGHDEREQTLNQLLVEMDGFDTQKGVIILAATNRPDVLDPALLRPGRFDRQVVIDTADVKGRLEILKVHTRGKPLESDVDLAVIAKRTPGFTGADLANAVNEAALLAARKDQKKITMADFEEAIDRVLAGPERKSRVISEKEKEIIAYHECGHAIVAALTPRCDPVHKVSIIPRGHAALGYTLQLPIEDRYIVTREELLARITSTLGGRAAEEIIYGHRSTGAQNDLEKCTEMARRMVCKYGMSDKLGPVSLGRAEGLVFLGRDLYDEKNFSEQTAIAVDNEVTRIVQECESQAKKLLLEHRDKLDLLARELQKREVMDGQEVMDVLRGAGARTPAVAPDGDGNLVGGRPRPAADAPVSTFSADATNDIRRT